MNEEPRFIAKPFFIPWMAFLSNLPFAIFISLFVGLMGIPLAMVLKQAIAKEISTKTFFTIYPLSLISIIAIILIYLQSRLYRKTEYKFYEDHVEYDKGFLSIEHKLVPYERITDISVRRGFLQQIRNLGNIRLETPLTLGGSAGQGLTSGIVLSDIEDPEKLYNEIKKLVFSKSK